MSAGVPELIAKCCRNGRLDDEAFILEQGNIPFASREAVRYSPEIAALFFGVERLEELDAGYYFWDNTTLCLKAPLLECVKDGNAVLEIGPGPAATLSILLQKARKDIRSVCCEINPDFIASARTSVRLNQVTVDVVESDMTAAVDGPFDVVFMNPPYVKADKLEGLRIDRESPEGRAGFAGEDGCDIIRRFLNEAPRVTRPAGIALLGINNWHVEDEAIVRLIERSPLRLRRRWYPGRQTAPHGPYSQVYLLEHRRP